MAKMKELNTQSIMGDIKEYVEKGVPYIDAIVEYAERNDIEVEVLGEMIKSSPVLKAHIQYEAEELNMLEQTARLPV